MGSLTVKSSFLEASFSQNLMHFQIFYVKNTFPHHFCSAHVVNPGQEWQEAQFREGRLLWDTCCASNEHEMPNMCCPFPPAARWKTQLLLRPRIFMALSRGREFPLVLLFIFHMIHVVWSFNSGSPGEHFILQPFVVHSFITCFPSAYHARGSFLDAGNLRMSKAQIDQGLKFMQMIPVFNCCPESSLEGMPYPEYLLSIPACIPPRAPKSSPLPTIAKKYEWYLDAQATTWELFRILLSLMLLHSIITNSR